MNQTEHAATTPSTARLAAAKGIWGSGGGLAALAVIVIQLLWRGSLLHRGWFTQDDFLLTTTCHQTGLTDLLSANYSGGFSPGGFALACESVEAAPLGWGLAAGSVLGLQSVAAILMWVVLTRILGPRWLRLPILVFFCVSTLTLWTTQWWSFGIQFWPAAILLLIAVWALTTAIRDRSGGAQILVVVASAAALLFHERAILFPLVLVGVALMVQAGETLADRVSTSARELRWTWLGLALLVAAYATLRLQLMAIEPVRGGDAGSVVTTYLRHSFSELTGGPWVGVLLGHAYLVPKSWAVALSVALLLALVGFTLQKGGPSARASWALFVAYLATSVGLLIVLGEGDLTSSLGLVHRFAADLAPVTAICVAGCLREVRVQPLRLPRLSSTISAQRFEILLSLAFAGLYALSSVGSTAMLAPNMYHADDRNYVAKLRSALRADPQIVLIDGGVPSGVISPLFGERARVSSVVGAAPENPVFDLPSQKLRIVGDSGELSPVELEGVVAMTPSDDAKCGYAVRRDGTWIPMQSTVPKGRWVLRLGYYTNVDGFAVVELPN